MCKAKLEKPSNSSDKKYILHVMEFVLKFLCIYRTDCISFSLSAFADQSEFLPLHSKFIGSTHWLFEARELVELPCQLLQKVYVPSAIRPHGEHNQQSGWLLFGCLKPSSVMTGLTHQAGLAPEERVFG